MSYEEECKVKAAIKVGLGVGRCVSGVMLTLGHGLLSAAIRTPGAQCAFGQALIRSGQETAKEGMDEWKR